MTTNTQGKSLLCSKLYLIAMSDNRRVISGLGIKDCQWTYSGHRPGSDADDAVRHQLTQPQTKPPALFNPSIIINNQSVLLFVVFCIASNLNICLFLAFNPPECRPLPPSRSPPPSASKALLRCSSCTSPRPSTWTSRKFIRPWVRLSQISLRFLLQSCD